MAATIHLISHLIRIAGASTHRVHALGVISAVILIVLGLAFVVGIQVADLLAPGPEELFAAPFRWRK